MTDLEQIIDEVAARLKRSRDISFWQTNPQLAPIINVLTKLADFPKAKIPAANFERVKGQVLDRIAIPTKAIPERTKMFAGFPAFIKLISGTIGTLLIVVSLGMGTAVAALQSVPGQTIYPLKKIVENVELKLTRDPAAKANLQIKFANTRLDELATVIEKNEAGEISQVETQKIVSQTISELEKTTAAALDSSTFKSSSASKQVSALNKLVDLSNKQKAVLTPLLSAATIRNDGEVKIVLEQALQTSLVSKEQAIKNIENAGLHVDDQPISILPDNSNKISANGKISSMTADTISIGTAKFLLTKDTEYANIRNVDLKIDLAVKITGEVRSDKKTYALSISPADTEKSIIIKDTNTETKPTETKPTSDTSVKP